LATLIKPSSKDIFLAITFFILKYFEILQTSKRSATLDKMQGFGGKSKEFIGSPRGENLVIARHH
jgi:hypothetical protein